MTSKIKHNQFFLISFLPAIAYWYLEANYDVKTAVLGGLALAILELVIEKIFIKVIHSISKLNFFLLLFLATLTLLGDEGIWFKLQPFFTGLCMGGYLLYKSSKKESLMLEMMDDFGKKNPLPDSFYTKLEKHMAFLMMAYGCFMAAIAIYTKTGTWLFFKTIGFYIVFFIFMIFEFINLRKDMKTTRKRF